MSKIILYNNVYTQFAFYAKNKEKIMLKIVVKRNSLHSGTGEIESTYDILHVDCKEIENFLLKKWLGMNDYKVVECVVEK